MRRSSEAQAAGQAQSPVVVPSVRVRPASATLAAAAAVTANPVYWSSAAAAKMTPSTVPSELISGPPELPLRTSALIV